MEENFKVKLKMVIVSAEPDVARDFERGFIGAGFLSLGCAFSAAEAIRLVEDRKPDFLVMEPYLPGMNCDELTAFLEQNASPFLVKLAISSRKQDLLASRFEAEGGDLFRLQPIDYSFTATQIFKHYNRRRNPLSENGPDRQREALEDLLCWFGMPRPLNGFSYIREGCVFAMQDPALLEDMKNRLYPLIAAHFQTTGYCVERSIRNAIEKMCEVGDLERIYRYFHPRRNSGKIPNKEFIPQLIALYRKGLQNN